MAVLSVLNLTVGIGTISGSLSVHIQSDAGTGSTLPYRTNCLIHLSVLNVTWARLGLPAQCNIVIGIGPTSPYRIIISRIVLALIITSVLAQLRLNRTIYLTMTMSILLVLNRG